MVFRGLFITQDVFEERMNYHNYEKRGVNNIIKTVESTLSTNYNQSKSIIDRTLSKLEGTEIEPYILIHQFKNSNGTRQFDDDQINFIAERSSQIITDYPKLKGIVFDDFYYEGKTDEELSNFAGTVKDSIKETNSKARLSAGINVTRNITEEFDFIIPMVYRYYNGYPSFIKDIITDLKTKTNTPIVTGLLTFMNDSDVTLWDKKTLECDMETAIKYSDGYAVFLHPFIPNRLKFKKTPYNSSYKYNVTSKRLIKNTQSPNFLFRNVADCGNSLNSTYGFGKYTNETIELDPNRYVKGKNKSIKCTVNGQHQGIVPQPGSLTTKIGTPITFSGKIYVPTGMDLLCSINNKAYGNTDRIIGNDKWNNFEVTYTPDGTGGFNDWTDGVWTILKIITRNNPGTSSFNLGELQIEVGSEATKWRPGK